MSIRPETCFSVSENFSHQTAGLYFSQRLSIKLFHFSINDETLISGNDLQGFSYVQDAADSSKVLTWLFLPSTPATLPFSAEQSNE